MPMVLPSVISLPLLHPKTLGNRCAQFKSPSLLSHLTHIVVIAMSTCHTNSLLSHIHINTAYPFDITCALLATGITLGTLECIWKLYSLSPQTNHMIIQFIYFNSITHYGNYPSLHKKMHISQRLVTKQSAKHTHCPHHVGGHWACTWFYWHFGN